MNDDGRSPLNSFIRELNDLQDWSLQFPELQNCVRERPFSDYVAWKPPFPADYIEDDQANRAVRSFFVGRLIQKIILLASEINGLDERPEIIRPYGIISEPSLWASEVGVVFSVKKWNDILHRDTYSKNYLEKTSRASRTILEAFGVLKPAEVSHEYMSHTIIDREEGISFQGGLHFIWIDQVNAA